MTIRLVPSEQTAAVPCAECGSETCNDVPKRRDDPRCSKCACVRITVEFIPYGIAFEDQKRTFAILEAGQERGSPECFEYRVTRVEGARDHLEREIGWADHHPEQGLWPLIQRAVALAAKDAAPVAVERPTVGPNPDGAVYFIRAGRTGHVKIGWSMDPPRRLADLQTASHQPLQLLGVVRGTVADEQALHERFGSVRAQGEWFRATADLRAYIVEHALQWRPGERRA